MRRAPTSVSPVNLNASWWLKLMRADRHLEDVEHNLRTYAARHPYMAVRVPRLEGEDSDLWRYNLVMTERPDPMVGLTIGDCVHDIRCALDHIVTAHLPVARRDRGSFPIFLEDPWETDASGRHVRPAKEREGFESAVTGLPERALALIKELQPYRRGEEAVYDPLAVVQTLDSADMHGEIATVLEGVEAIATRVIVRGDDISEHLRHGGAVLETGGTVKTDRPVAVFRLADRTVTEKEVEVKLSGTAVVAVYVDDLATYYRTPDTLRIAIDYVGDHVLLPLLKAVEDQGPLRTLGLPRAGRSPRHP